MRGGFAAVVSTLTCAALVCGIAVPFKKSTVSAGKSYSRAKLSPRDDPYGFQNMRDNVYTAELFVAGQNFTVQIDTGSSDLWIDPAVAGAVLQERTLDTGVQSAICYIDTTCAAGPILIGNVTFGNLSVPEQAFINAVGSNATYEGMNGLLGLGSTVLSASSISLDLQQDASFLINGNTFVENALNAYPAEANFMSFLLSRSETGVVDGGTFTIGEIAPGMQDILQTPELPVLSDTRWESAINGMIINGVAVIAPSASGSPALLPGQLLMNLDTGTARAAAPPIFVDAMYKNIPGAEFDGKSEYTLPCQSMVTVDIVIGNRTFPIHPIDLVIIADQGESPRTDGSDFICVGAFSYLEPGSTDIDVILGDTFMRNVYALYNFGNWTRTEAGPPYVQLLSTTDEAEAEAEFSSLNNARVAARRTLPAPSGRQSSSAPSLLHRTLSPQSLLSSFSLSLLLHLV